MRYNVSIGDACLVDFVTFEDCQAKCFYQNLQSIQLEMSTAEIVPELF